MFLTLFAAWGEIFKYDPAEASGEGPGKVIHITHVIL